MINYKHGQPIKEPQVSSEKAFEDLNAHLIEKVNAMIKFSGLKVYNRFVKHPEVLDAEVQVETDQITNQLRLQIGKL